MSILDGFIWSSCSIALTCPARSHVQRTLNRKRWAQGCDKRFRSSREGDELEVHDGKVKNRRKKKTGDRFLKSWMLPYCGCLGGSAAKKWRKVPGVPGTLGKANSHFDPTQTGSGTYHNVETVVDWCSIKVIRWNNCW